jgi:cardiolipin synthase A/B
MQTYTIYTAADYFDTITRQIAATKQGDRVALISMAFNPTEEPTKAVLHELTVAAARGVTVDFVTDAYTFIQDSHELPLGPIFWKHDPLEVKHPRLFFEKAKALKKLRAAGARYAIINEPTSWPSLPIAGRSHIKATVINDEVYVGGCNLEHTFQIDYMVRVRQPATAAWIYKLIRDIATRKSTLLALEQHDHSRRLDAQTTILVDAGIRGKSIILEEALQLIDEAREWLVITCQFFPDGVTAQHLEAARTRGVKLYSIYKNTSQNAPVWLAFHYAISAHERLRHHKDLFAGKLPKNHPWLHAKLIATEQGAMIGSHNYVNAGVRFGTAEIALLRHDPAFAREAVSLLIPQLPQDGTYPLPNIN